MKGYISQVAKAISNQVDEFLKEGLRLKGIVFDNDNELIEILKGRVRQEYAISNLNLITYYLDDKPFAQIDHTQNMESNNEDGCYSMKCSIKGGRYL